MAGTTTRIRQGKQVRNSETYDDTRPSGAGMESTPVNLEDDINNLRTQLRKVIGPIGKWYDQPLTDLAALFLGGGGGGGAARYLHQPLTGLINGSNVVFTTAAKFTRNGLTNESVYLNGVLQVAADDYVPSESVPTTGYDTITMVMAPRVGDKLTIDFSPV